MQSNRSRLGVTSDVRHLAAAGCVLLSLAGLASCGGEGARRSGVLPTGEVPAPTATAGVGGPTSSGPAYKISVASSALKLKTLGSGTNECADLTATVSLNNKPAADVDVSFEVVAKKDQKDKGEANPSVSKTDTKGVASSKYCSGKDEGAVVVRASAGSSSANTADIEVSVVPGYRFSWKDAKEKAFARQARELSSSSDKLAELLASPPNDTDAAKPISLSLRGGGNDCSIVEFELTRDGLPVSGEKVTFQTQEEFPVGVKLANREGTGLTRENPVSGKLYAYVDATSNADGVFQVPVCSGTLPGNLLISGTYVESDGRVHETKSPLIVMSGGVANYGFLSLTFNDKNSRVVSVDTFTNTQNILAFVARLGTLNNGSVIKSYPLAAIAEIGKVMVDGNGFPNDAGEVKFTYEALNVRGQRPIPAHPSLPDLQFSSATGFSACDPLRFTPTAQGGVGPTDYSTLAENWRSTLVYYVRGAEFARVNNPTGVFDASKAFGIWDVNQNGVYDGNFINDQSIDKITVVPANRTQSSFNPSVDDWFIDLPGPFVDANENGRYDVGETLVGDKYSAPNQKFDSDAYIWKSVVVPLNLGATAYSLQHSRISSVITDTTPSAGWTEYLTFLQSLNASGYGTQITSAGATQLFGQGATVQSSSNNPSAQDAYLYFHAQDKCGNPLPGGKKINANYVVTGQKATIGPRAVTAHFHVQPYDSLRESSKRLLAKADGSSETVVNSDLLEHPAKKASYPIQLRVRIDECTNFCSGDLHPDVATDPPVFCIAESGRLELHVEGDITISHPVSIPEVFQPAHTSGRVSASNKCGCASGAVRQGSTCTCPAGTAVSGASCVVPP